MSNTPPPNLVRLVRRAAELRATGHSWEAVARDVGKSADAVRGWARRYAAFWAQETAATRRERIEDAGAEALALLRQQLRSTDDKAVREAAKQLLSHQQAVAPPEPPAPRSDLLDLVTYLEGLSDADLDSLLGPESDPDAPRPEANPAGGEDPPVPD